MKRLDKSEIIFKVLAYVLLTMFALLCLYPLVYVVSVSISSVKAVEGGKVVLYPIGFQTGALKAIIMGEYGRKYWLAYSNTIYYTVFGTAVSMFVAITGAYALSKTRLMFGRGFNFLLVFTMWFNAGMIPTYKNFRSLGINNMFGYIIGIGFNAFNIILLRNAFSGVPHEIEEAATIDGATEFQLLTKIYIPMSKASVATVTMFYAISRWNGWFWATMILDDSDYPLQAHIRDTISSIAQEDSVVVRSYANRSLQYAMLVCSIIPIVIIYPQMQKYFAAGVNVGGVKE